MPPKKNEQPEAKPLIGRVGTNLKVGIVGLPNGLFKFSGISLLFMLLD